MKKIILWTIILFTGIFYSGCAQNQNAIFDVDKEKGIKNNVVYANKSNIINEINIEKLSYYKRKTLIANEMLRTTLKIAAEETIRNNKTDFIIINDSMNQLNGSLPVNTYYGISEYCFNSDYTNNVLSYEKKCDNIIDVTGVNTLKYIMLSNPDYRMISINAKEILKELAEYRLTEEEINKIKE